MFRFKIYQKFNTLNLIHSSLDLHLKKNIRDIEAELGLITKIAPFVMSENTFNWS